MATFWQHLGIFLFQHLVTLPCDAVSIGYNWNNCWPILPNSTYLPTYLPTYNRAFYRSWVPTCRDWADLLLTKSMMKDTASVTRLGDFWQLMVTNFVRKVAQISCLVLGYFEKHHFLIKTVAVTFGQLFEEFGLHFIPTSGHTHSQCLFRFRVCVVILNDEAEFHLVAVLILPSYLRYLPIPTNLGT